MMIITGIQRWLDRRRRGIKIWGKCNVYPTAVLGDRVNIGTFSEIGDGVIIGSDVRIGAMCFIPNGVRIYNDAWIGPRVTFTNDRYPPSDKSKWEKTHVHRGARLGACVTVVCGVDIGSGALVGSGSVVVCDIPAGQVWAGVPATRIG